MSKKKASEGVLTAPKGHSIPPLLTDFAEWLGGQDYQKIGRIEIDVCEPYWGDDHSDIRLKRDAFAFIRTGDDDQIILLTHGKNDPPAVCLMGNEGASDTLANSFEEFLYALTGEGVQTIEFAPEAAKSLKAWLKKKGVKVPKAKALDFSAYLDGESGTPKTLSTSQSAGDAQPIPETMKVLAPTLRQVASIVGRRADDPELLSFITEKLGKKVPDSITPMNSKSVADKKRGLEFHFDHQILHEQYPPVPKSKNSFVPYLDVAWIRKETGEELPFGLKFGMTNGQLRKLLGPPEKGGEDEFPRWILMLDPRRDLVLKVEENRYWLQILEATKLSLGGNESKRTATGVFVAWAASRKLLNDSRFASHLPQLESVRQRKMKGSDFVDAAFPLGLWDVRLWDVHLADLPGLRDFAEKYSRNEADNDFKKALGLPEITLHGDESVESLNKLVSDTQLYVKTSRKEVTAPGHFESRAARGGKAFAMLSLWTGSELVEIKLSDIRELRRDVVYVADDDWATVDKLTPVFDKQFAKWVKPGRK